MEENIVFERSGRKILYLREVEENIVFERSEKKIKKLMFFSQTLRVWNAEGRLNATYPKR